MHLLCQGPADAPLVTHFLAGLAHPLSPGAGIPVVTSRGPGHLLMGKPHVWNPIEREHFIDGCLHLVHQEITPRNSYGFYTKLADHMASKTGTVFNKDTLSNKFYHLKTKWQEYQMCKVELAAIKPLEASNESREEQETSKTMRLNKFRAVLAFEEKLDEIFIKCDEDKSAGVVAHRLTSPSSGKRSFDEPFLRQLRQKSSKFHMHQSVTSQWVSPYDKGVSSAVHMQQSVTPQLVTPYDMGYRSAMDDLTTNGILTTSYEYLIAAQLLENDRLRYAYSLVPSLEAKLYFLRETWKLKHNP